MPEPDARFRESRTAQQWWASLQRTFSNGTTNPEADTKALAYLRRASAPIEAAYERRTIDLCKALGFDDRRLERTAVLAATLALIREDTGGPRFGFARSLGAAKEGGDTPILSDIRLRRLCDARDAAEVMRCFREAVLLLDGKAPVRDVAETVLAWLNPQDTDDFKTRFLFNYHQTGFATEADAAASEEIPA